MSLVRLALRNISGSAFRSWVIFLCVLVVASFSLATTLVMRGAGNSLELARKRLGADIVVIPRGAQAKVETALLMGRPVAVWMPSETLGQVAQVEGVAAASPQIYLSTLTGAACCSVSEMFLIAYDPDTDFTVSPWLIQRRGEDLSLGEVVGGTYVFTPDGENIRVYGYIVTLVANLEPTGTGIDQTMFMTDETALDIARLSAFQAEKPLEIPADSISAVMVKVAPGADRRQVAASIAERVPGVTVIESPNLFQSYRAQIDGLLKTVLSILGIVWVLALAAIGIVFSMVVSERSREIGVLRVLGATRSFVLRSLLAEAGLLALSGAVLGVVLALSATYLFGDYIRKSLEIRFVMPAPSQLLVFLGAGLLVSAASVILAAFIPAHRISQLEPALAMRE